jgi:hypothetical protein
MADASAAFLQFHIWMLKFLLNLFTSSMIGSCLQPQLLFNVNLPVGRSPVAQHRVAQCLPVGVDKFCAAT